jgi:RND family efflux transporter MFP subunit
MNLLPSRVGLRLFHLPFVVCRSLCSVLFCCLTAHAAAPAPVKTAQVARGEVVRYVTLPGTLKANQQATLYAKVGGYLTNVAVDKGDMVKADQVLAVIEVPELIADMKKFEADAKVAETDLGRLQDAQKKAADLVMPQMLDKARGAAEVARANIQRTQTLLDFAKIVAPFGGLITQRFVDSGSFVPSATSGSAAQNAALLTIMDTTVLRAQVAMPELDAALVAKGQPVKISLESQPGKTIDASVSRLAGAIDEGTRTMIVEADVPNAEGALRAGSYATIKVGVERHAATLFVPVDALTMEKTAAFVFKIADGKAKKTAVTLGFNDEAKAEVLTGLAEGEAVILVGKAAFADGQPVQVSEGK